MSRRLVQTTAFYLTANNALVDREARIDQAFASPGGLSNPCFKAWRTTYRWLNPRGAATKLALSNSSFLFGCRLGNADRGGATFVAICTAGNDSKMTISAVLMRTDGRVYGSVATRNTTAAMICVESNGILSPFARCISIASTECETLLDFRWERDFISLRHEVVWNDGSLWTGASDDTEHKTQLGNNDEVLVDLVFVELASGGAGVSFHRQN